MKKLFTFIKELGGGVGLLLVLFGLSCLASTLVALPVIGWIISFVAGVIAANFWDQSKRKIIPVCLGLILLFLSYECWLVQIPAQPLTYLWGYHIQAIINIITYVTTVWLFYRRYYGQQL